MSFSFRNMFTQDDNGEPLGDRDSSRSEGEGENNAMEYEVSELLPFIPPAIVAEGGLPMENVVRIPLPTDGSNDVRLSTIYQACPGLFAAEITPLNDSVVNLPEKEDDDCRNESGSPVVAQAQNPFLDGLEACPAIDQDRKIPTLPSDPPQHAMDSKSITDDQTFGFPNFDEKKKQEKAPPSAGKQEDAPATSVADTLFSGAPMKDGFAPPKESASNPFEAPEPGANPEKLFGHPFQAMPSEPGEEGEETGEEESHESNPFENGGSESFDTLFSSVETEDDVESAEEREKSSRPVGSLFEEATSGEFAGVKVPGSDSDGEEAAKGEKGEKDRPETDSSEVPVAGLFEAADEEPANDLFQALPRADAAEDEDPSSEEASEVSPASGAFPPPLPGSGDAKAKSPGADLFGKPEPSSSPFQPAPEEEKGEVAAVAEVSSFGDVVTEETDSAGESEQKGAGEARAESVPEIRAEDSSPGRAFTRDLVFRALFNTNEGFTVQKVCDRVASMEGVLSCAVAAGREVAEGCVDPANSFGGNVEKLAEHARGLALLTSEEGAASFSIQTDRGMMTFFFGRSTVLTVKHEPEVFKPGVRERLVLISQALDGFGSEN